MSTLQKTKTKPKPNKSTAAHKINSKLNVIISISLMTVVLIAVGSLAGAWWYQQHHTYSNYGPNTAGNISFDDAYFKNTLESQGWEYSIDSGSTNAYSESLFVNIPGNPYEDSQSVKIQKVRDTSMKYSLAESQAAKLRNDKTQLLKDAGYGINVLPPSMVVIRVGSKHVRLPTVEFSEYYTFRFEESHAYYVQDGYYIDIQRNTTTMGNANPNHTQLIGQTNTALKAFSISD